MRLFSKVFFSITIILCLSLALFGCLMLSASFTQSMKRETERGLDAWRMTAYMLHNDLLKMAVTGKQDAGMFEEALSRTTHSGYISLFEVTGEFIYSEYQGNRPVRIPDASGDVGEAEPDHMNLRYEVQELDDGHYLTVSGPFLLIDHHMILTLSSNVTDIVHLADQQITDYRIIYVSVCMLSLLAVLVFAAGLVRPIGQVVKSATRIAKGDYAARVKVHQDDELGDLANSFNAMAHAVDRSVEALNMSVAQKEDFVGNFAHELKTPLTSVIGYADMLSQKDLPPEEVKHYAGYILDEGLRLEALSYKLMEMIVLNKQDFTLEELPVTDVLDHVVESIRPMLAEQHISLQVVAEPAYIRVEFDLFKTMLLNLIDNAKKADAKTIVLTGKVVEEKRPSDAETVVHIRQKDMLMENQKQNGPFYVIGIKDDGCGMPKEALSRITEAFYMVDKSRARAQHGAGLGLALVKRIVHLHKAELTFESEEHKGTVVRVILPLAENMETA